MVDSKNNPNNLSITQKLSHNSKDKYWDSNKKSWNAKIWILGISTDVIIGAVIIGALVIIAAK